MPGPLTSPRGRLGAALGAPPAAGASAR